jgi:hypothetical protein
MYAEGKGVLQNYGPRRGKWCALTYYVAQEPYLQDVSKWNCYAAIATAVAMACWAVQTLADLFTHT